MQIGMESANQIKVKRRSPPWICLLYTSDAADERSSVDLGGRRIIKKKNNNNTTYTNTQQYKRYGRK